MHASDVWLLAGLIDVGRDGHGLRASELCSLRWEQVDLPHSARSEARKPGDAPPPRAPGRCSLLGMTRPQPITDPGAMRSAAGAYSNQP